MTHGLSTLLISAIATVLIVAGTLTVDTLREDENRVPLQTNSTTPITSPEQTYVPTSMVNATQLEAICLSQCAGGKCVQSSITGATVCTTCVEGYSLDPVSQACVGGAQCGQWPWCTSVEADRLKSYQSVISAVGESTNYTALPLTSSALSDVEAFIGSSRADSITLANLYYADKKSLLASNNSASDVSRYWDDQATASSSLSIYQTMLLPVYTAYVTAMKFKVCSRTWIPGNGGCIAPSV
jgi:hypothetical protein